MDISQISEFDLKQICSFARIKDIKNGRVILCEGGFGDKDFRDNPELEDILPRYICFGAEISCPGNDKLEWFYGNEEKIRSCNYCRRKSD
jgi:hypothetical protein